DMNDLRASKPDIDRHENATTPRHTVMRREQRFTVHRDERDAIAGLDAARPQPTCERDGAIVEFAVRKPPLPVHNGVAIGKGPRRALEEADGRQRCVVNLSCVSGHIRLWLWIHRPRLY